jgi:hypothetical protein
MQMTSTKKCLVVIAAAALTAAYGWAQTPILSYSFPASWDGTGTVVTDLSAGGNNGSIKVTPSLSPTVPSWAAMGTQSLNTSGGSILTDNTLQLNNAAVAAAGGFSYDVSFLWDGTHRSNWGSVQKILDYAGTESLQLVTSDGGQANLIMRFDDSQDVLSTVILPDTWYSVSVQFDTQGNTVDGNGDLAGVVSMAINGGSPLSAAATKTKKGDDLVRGIGIGQLALANHLVYLDGLIYDPSVSLGVTVIPEPTTLSLVGLGGLLLFIRRKKA